MSTDLTTLLVAGVGITGTLLSPVLSQYLARRARQQEIDADRIQRLDDNAADLHRRNLRERRDCYIGLNASARRHRQALLTFLLEPSPQARATLDEARRTYSDCHAECQLMAPDSVLEADAIVSFQLGGAYGEVLRYADTQANDNDHAPELERIKNFIDGQLSDSIRSLRQAMRDDLGIAQTPSFSSEATCDGPHPIS